MKKRAEEIQEGEFFTYLGAFAWYEATSRAERDDIDLDDRVRVRIQARRGDVVLPGGIRLLALQEVVVQERTV